jgi:type IV pilus assembly protein PilE
MNTKRNLTRRRIRGFSLLELMAAIAVIGILLGIAIPGFRDHLRRGAIEAALAEMSRGQVALEQFFLDNHTYAGAACPAGTDRFAMTCALGPSTYTITATGSGTVQGFVYTLNEQGVRATTGGDWGTNTTCWIIRKGGTCGG